MTTRSIRLDDLVGRIVRDQSGRAVGRIYDMKGERQNGELVIVEYHLGASALLQRIGLSLIGLVGFGHASEPKKVPWNRLDISDPDHPKLISP
jgi:sporulation protein YlmC with PRC-barrel domain